jgi:hypothetical protein
MEISLSPFFMLFRSTYISFQWQEPFCRVCGAEIEHRSANSMAPPMAVAAATSGRRLGTCHKNVAEACAPTELPRGRNTMHTPKPTQRRPLSASKVVGQMRLCIDFVLCSRVSCWRRRGGVRLSDGARNEGVRVNDAIGWPGDAIVGEGRLGTTSPSSR